LILHPIQLRCVSEQITYFLLDSSVDICNICFLYVEKARNRRKFTEKLKESQRNPLVLLHTELARSVKDIESTFPEYQKLLQIIGMEHTEDNAYDLKVRPPISPEFGVIFFLDCKNSRR
jgi:hypothetical protein